MKFLQKELTIFYYSVYILAALLAVVGYVFHKNGFIITNSVFIDNFKIIVILYMLISIPLTLKNFSSKVKKIAQIENENEKFAKYLNISKIRIMLFAIIIHVGVISFFVLKRADLAKPMFDFLYIAAIGVVALFFCNPTKNKIENDFFNE